MTEARVTLLRSVDVGVTDLAQARRFYSEVWLLTEVAEDDGVVRLAGTGPIHHVLTLRESPRPGVLRVELGASDAAAVDALHRRIMEAGRPVSGPPARLARPGGGYGFSFQDPEGRNFSIVAEAADGDRPGGASPLAPVKLSHVNLNSADNETSFAFMRDVLGFRLSDQTSKFRFIRCNADHHSLVLGFNEEATLNHIAFELPDLEALMLGIGRMRDHGYPSEWGPGRHGPGNNAFAYFVGPEELPLEYTAEMMQVDDGYPVGMPERWTWPKGRVDHWGLTPGPSARVVRTQRLFRFPPEGYRLAL
ncbi:VOC family protein [Sabulicella rubraurantiaca]|uniref:VOC family protein n=1 Tax=Sabulicella rubraurantiaca TaxID=2811429 RepID=UPI001A977133|nr:VOC family protein [Sabulicella rubraurantiaca]